MNVLLIATTTTTTTTTITTTTTTTTTPWLYNPCRTLASFTTVFQSSLLCARILQFVTTILLRSSLTSSIHLNLGLPTLLLPSGVFWYNIFTMLSSLKTKRDTLVLQVGGWAWGWQPYGGKNSTVQEPNSIIKCQLNIQWRTKRELLAKLSTGKNLNLLNRK